MSESAQMPRYVCHKVVHALKIESIDASLEPGLPVYLKPADHRYERIQVSQQWCREKRVDRVPDCGYYVVYEDGYTSWSPSAAFEKGYTREVVQQLLDAEAVRAKPKLSAESPWVTTMQRLVDAFKKYSAKDISTEAYSALDAAEKLLEDGVALGVDPFEQALIDVLHATDGQGRAIRLYPSSDYSALALRRAVMEYGQPNFESIHFQRDEGTKQKDMAAWYRNLALLARAAAAAIEREIHDR